jgi:hypothetical protein
MKTSTRPAANASSYSRRGGTSILRMATHRRLNRGQHGRRGHAAGVALTLNPLSVHGLWLAVITIPAPGMELPVKYDTTWVGTASGGSWSDAVGGRTSMQARAKGSEASAGHGRPPRRAPRSPAP